MSIWQEKWHDIKKRKARAKAHTLLNSRARARVRIKKRNLANIRKNDVKIIRIIVGQGKESRNIPSDKIRALRFLCKFSRFLSEFLSPRVLRPQFWLEPRRNTDFGRNLTKKVKIRSKKWNNGENLLDEYWFLLYIN